MLSKRAEKLRADSAKRRLKAIQSLPRERLRLAEHLMMSSLEEARALAQAQNASSCDRKLAIMVFEAVQEGDWPMFDEILTRRHPKWS